jgi:hypothetical protein
VPGSQVFMSGLTRCLMVKQAIGESEDATEKEREHAVAMVPLIVSLLLPLPARLHRIGADTFRLLRLWAA